MRKSPDQLPRTRPDRTFGRMDADHTMDSEPAGGSDDAVPLRCLECGYNLRGHTGIARCSECGASWDPDDPRYHVPRPFFGWFLLAIPPLAAPIAIFGATWTFFEGGCLLLFSGLLLGPLLIVLIAYRLAIWRYSQAVRNQPDRNVFPSYKAYVVRTTVVLSLLDLALTYMAVEAYIMCVPWLTQMGYLPRGWS